MASNCCFTLWQCSESSHMRTASRKSLHACLNSFSRQQWMSGRTSADCWLKSSIMSALGTMRDLPPPSPSQSKETMLRCISLTAKRNRRLRCARMRYCATRKRTSVIAQPPSHISVEVINNGIVTDQKNSGYKYKTSRGKITSRYFIVFQQQTAIVFYHATAVPKSQMSASPFSPRLA